MDDYRDRLVVEISKLSKNIFLSFFGFGVVYFLSFILELKWLGAISGTLLMFAVIVSWLTPGIFILFGKPWYAHAWLGGINPFAYSVKSWRHVASGIKVAVF